MWLCCKSNRWEGEIISFSAHENADLKAFCCQASAISMGAKVHCTYENVEPAIMMTSLEVYIFLRDLYSVLILPNNPTLLFKWTFTFNLIYFHYFYFCYFHVAFINRFITYILSFNFTYENQEIEVKPWRAHALTEMVTWYQSPQ